MHGVSRDRTQSPRSGRVSFFLLRIPFSARGLTLRTPPPLWGRMSPRCKKCKGERTVPDKKRVEVQVERGMHAGERIVVKGEGDESVRCLVSHRLGRVPEGIARSSELLT